MKQLKYILMFFILLSSCTQKDRNSNSTPEYFQKIINDETENRANLNLQGDVRSILEYTLLVADTITNEEIILVTHPRYNLISADTLIKKIRTSSIEDSYSFKFDESGNALKSIRWTSYVAQVDSRTNNIFIYDEKNNLIQKKTFKTENGFPDQTLKIKIDFTYNKYNQLEGLRYTDINRKKEDVFCANLEYNGMEILLTQFMNNSRSDYKDSIAYYKIDESGIFDMNDERLIRTYNDDNGKLEKLIFRDTLFNLDRYTTLFNYDENNNLIQEIEYGEDNSMSSSESHFYDKENKLRLRIFESHGDFEKKYFNYNGDPLNVFSETKYLGNDSFNITSSTKYKYDNLNNLIFKQHSYKQKYSKEEITTSSHSYIFDDKENWIEKKTFQNDSLTNVARREITYY